MSQQIKMRLIDVYGKSGTFSREKHFLYLYHRMQTIALIDHICIDFTTRCIQLWSFLNVEADESKELLNIRWLQKCVGLTESKIFIEWTMKELSMKDLSIQILQIHKKWKQKNRDLESSNMSVLVEHFRYFYAQSYASPAIQFVRYSIRQMWLRHVYAFIALFNTGRRTFDCYSFLDQLAIVQFCVAFVLIYRLH